MPKHVSESTFQLSVRIDTRSLNRIDKVRDKLEQQTGAKPQRSDIVRKAIDYGMEVYCKQYNIDVKPPAAESEAPVEEPVSTPAEPPATVPEPKKPTASKKSGKKGSAKQARA